MWGRVKEEVRAAGLGISVQPTGHSPLGGRDGLACGEPLQPWGQRLITTVRETGLSGKSVFLTVVIHSSDPDAVGARQRHALPWPAVFLYFQEPALGDRF